MANKTYPIFISYRHSDTADKAEHLLSLLESAGYKGRVSFDRENLSVMFDLEILRRLDASKDFIVILGAETLAKIKNEETAWYKRLASCSVDEFSQLEQDFTEEKSRCRQAIGQEIKDEFTFILS